MVVFVIVAPHERRRHAENHSSRQVPRSRPSGRDDRSGLSARRAPGVRRERLPRGARTWGHLAVAAFFLNALPFSLFAYAELSIPSTLAGICNATSPLWGMALSLLALSEDRPTLAASPDSGSGSSVR